MKKLSIIVRSEKLDDVKAILDECVNPLLEYKKRVFLIKKIKFTTKMAT